MTKIRAVLSMILLFCSVILNAQAPASSGNVEMANDFTSSGKIYVVIAVVLIILAGLLFYVISVDRKVSKMEKEIEKNRK